MSRFFLAKSDLNIAELWKKLGEMKYSDFDCAYQSTKNIPVKCSGFPCSKFVMHQNMMGKLDFVGCVDRLYVHSVGLL